MNEYFHGWRRKAGVAALVLALATVGLWMRSRVVTDTLFFPILERQHVVYIVAGHVVWSGGFSEVPTQFARYSRARRKEDILLLHTQPSWLSGTVQWAITLRSLGISLTLLSAYLILWKPRKRAGTQLVPTRREASIL